MAEFDMTPLWDAIRMAKKRKATPALEGEVKTVLPVDAYLTEDDWLLLLVATSHLEEHHRDVFNLFLTEDFIAGLLVEFLASHDEVSTWEQVVEYLREQAEQGSAWLVSVPIANMQLSQPSVALSDATVLVRTRNERDWQLEDREVSKADVWKHLNDSIALRPRWLPHENEELIDTRNGAAFILVERATQELALSVARSRARYALATWCVLKPPTYQEVWPSVGGWAPQPWLHLEGSIKPHEPGKWTGATSPRFSVYVYGEYSAPDDERTLRAPFDAMAVAAERRSARALLAASWWLYLSNRRPNELEVAERLLALVTAAMSLCDPGGEPASDEKVFKRWLRVAERLDVWGALDEIRLTKARLRTIHERLRDVRNIAVHGADAVLVNLGYPSDDVRTMRNKRTVSGSDLALAVIDSAWQPLAYAVPRVVAHLWNEALDSEFDAERFEKNFVA